MKKKMKYLKTFNEGYNYQYKKVDNPNFIQFKENITNMLLELGKSEEDIKNIFDNKIDSIEDMWKNKVSEEKAIELLVSLSNRFKYVSSNSLFNLKDQSN